ncbi:MAG TPA: class I SAM-dependent methyltransferase [Terracidiphilus sp.]|nr:class I SAM-dependent methyltransferase [Terracidiphilus sp.]
MHDRRFAASQAHRLDDPARKVWLPHAEVLGALGLHPGDTVADIGAGTGYFSLPIAQAVSPGGRVYAVDAQEEMLSWLKQKLNMAGIANVDLVQAEAESTTLPSSSCDCYFMANVWHELEDCGAAVQEARRSLRPGGKVAVLDWRPDVEPAHGPPLAHRLSPSHAMEHLRAAGFDAVSHMHVGQYAWLVQGETRP